MLSALVWVIIICAVAALAMWAVRELAPPSPIDRVARVVIIGIAILLIIGIVAGLFGIDTGMPRLTP
jgi:heme A synthase